MPLRKRYREAAAGGRCLPKSYPRPGPVCAFTVRKVTGRLFIYGERFCCHAGAPGEPLLPEGLWRPCSRADGLTASANAGTTSFGIFGASGGVRPFAPSRRCCRSAARKNTACSQARVKRYRAGRFKNFPHPGWPAGKIERHCPVSWPPKSLPGRSVGRRRGGRGSENAVQEGRGLSRLSR